MDERDKVASSRLAGLVAWGLWAVMVLVYGTGVSLVIAANDFRYDEAVTAVAFAAFPTVGALIVSRRWRNTVGWILLAIGIGTTITFFDAAYLQYGMTLYHHPLPGSLTLDWAGNLIWPFNIGLATFLLLLFPTGRLLSPRWRAVAWLTAILTVASALSGAFIPGPFSGETTINPYGIEALGGVLSVIYNITQPLGALVALVAVVCAVLRFARSRGMERAQLKWFALGAAVLVVCFASGTVFFPETSSLGQSITDLGFLALPLGVGIAVLRYRLYDIDLIIRRTLLYGALSALLAGVYFGCVIGFQRLALALTGIDALPPVGIVASTLLIAALFNPLRHRLQSTIDRRFYRRKYDAARTLAAFARTLRNEVDLEPLRAHLTQVVRETMQPEHVSLWLTAPSAYGAHTPDEG